VDRLYDQFLVLLAAMVLEELGLVLEPFLLLDRLFYIHSKKKREPKQGKYGRIRFPKVTLLSLKVIRNVMKVACLGCLPCENWKNSLNLVQSRRTNLANF
jgi:hypothetical protein